MSSRDVNDDDYYTSDDDYEYDYDDDGDVSDDDDPQPMETNDDDDDAELSTKEKGYDFETEDDVRRTSGSPTRGGAVGLLTTSPAGRHAITVPTALNDMPLTCAICFDAYAPGEMRSAGCSHYYCHGCWRGYVHVAVTDAGSGCLLLRCPDPPCRVPVVRELVDAVATGADRARYATFVVRSFVEEGTSRYVRWCPGPGCTLAVRSRPGSGAYEVTCRCNHVFCFRCGDEAHRPSSCDTTRAWVVKSTSEGETAKWVLANTKHCPKCKRAIEKNLGCNHMTCGAPCKHEFCWICLGSWKGHAGGYYRCNVYMANPSEFDEETTRREQAKASLERYLHYYERWCAHGASMKKARQDLDGLQGGGLDRVAEEMGRQPTEMDFLLEAYAQIVEARRVLRWTYAYVYYLDPERDEVKRRFCEYLQGVAE
ncbi:hypothetical protein HU200_034056 [Digitaria exilis]|uniref:RBR-type E3 ubiquitin transferase n=1 Tax=Digitaria exilis TaxID=1010633 RepID=A0A835BU99_9POAL|nr:hypothetical protein HU200_034056 [Digitaria exilis]